MLNEAQVWFQPDTLELGIVRCQKCWVNILIELKILSGKKVKDSYKL